MTHASISGCLSLLFPSWVTFPFCVTRKTAAGPAAHRREGRPSNYCVRLRAVPIAVARSSLPRYRVLDLCNLPRSSVALAAAGGFAAIHVSSPTDKLSDKGAERFVIIRYLYL